MKKTFSVFLVLLLVTLLVTSAGCSKGEDSASKKKLALETLKQKTSYAVGYNMGKTLRDISARVEIEPLLQGIRDAQKDGENLLPGEEIENLYRDFMQETQRNLNEVIKEVAEKNKAEGERFLAANKNKEGVITTESGLQYIILKEGQGKTPTMADNVVVHYHGTLINGTVFDSSVDRKQPARFSLNGVIKGFSEALMLMKEGAKFRIFLPSELAYGNRGVGEVIGPNTVLIFELELIKIESK